MIHTYQKQIKMTNSLFSDIQNRILTTQLTRQINRIIIHCTATPEGRDHNVQDVDRWHKARGWQGIGYHYLIKLDGTIEVGRNLSSVGAHVHGHNHDSVGIVYVGGLDKDLFKPKDTRTPEQKMSLKLLVSFLRTRWPNVTIHGHNEFSSKACPSFDVQKENWDINSKNTATMEFEKLRELILETWARPKGLLKPENYQAQSMKVVEELGETFGALLKGKKEETIDGIGDILVTLIILSEQVGVNPTEALEFAWNEIRDRTGKMVDGVFVKD